MSSHDGSGRARRVSHGDGPDDPNYGGLPPNDHDGAVPGWVWPAGALVAVAWISVAVLAVALFSGDDGNHERLKVAKEIETPASSQSASPSPAPISTENEEPTPSPIRDGDDDEGGGTDEPGGQPAQVIGIDESGDRVVYLTFDADADRGSAEEILDLLQDEGISASFGITGQWAEANPDIVERVVNEGHAVFNHTYSHRSFTGAFTGDAPISAAERKAEIERTDEVLAEIAGTDGRPFWRPPFGAFDDEALALLGELDYRYCLMWTIDSHGWLGLTAEGIVARVLDQMQPGAIVLMHVGLQSQDSAALDDIIGALRADGYEFATVDRLATYNAGSRSPG